MTAHVVVDLGYGDAGKGLVTDYLVRKHNADGVVRYGGGAQCAHNVVLPDGRHHTFSMFGSGTFAGVPTYLSNFVLVNPHQIFMEGEQLFDLGIKPWQNLLYVQQDALITTPFHVAANRIREQARGQNRHGSCGLGIGETISSLNNDHFIQASELHEPDLLRGKLKAIQTYLRHSVMEDHSIESIPEGWNNRYTQMLIDPQQINDCMEIYRIFAKVVPLFDEFDFSDGTWIFEGHQGVLLDEYVGFHPHTTWAKTTLHNVADLLRGYEGHDDFRIYGVMRSYTTRHGAGPLVTEDPALNERFPEGHNAYGEWQGSWRVGWTDLVALKYALAAAPVDELVITHMDRVEGDWKVAVAYSEFNPLLPPPQRLSRTAWEHYQSQTLRILNDSMPEYVNFTGMTPDSLSMIIESATGTPVTMHSYGPTHEDVRELAMV